MLTKSLSSRLTKAGFKVNSLPWFPARYEATDGKYRIKWCESQGKALNVYVEQLIHSGLEIYDRGFFAHTIKKILSTIKGENQC